MKNAMKGGFQRFCDGTALHGFAELYHAKTLFWKTFWIIICCGAMGVTAYQLIKRVQEFATQTPANMITSVDEDKIVYPPLSLCYYHWMYWVDFRKVKDSKIDKGALLFSFNFYTPIYSMTPFDLDVAELNLTSYLKYYNYSSVFDFHKSLARDVPIVINDDLSPYFKQMSVIQRNYNFLFCYTITGEEIFKYLNIHKNQLNSNLNEIQAGADAKKSIRFSTIIENYDYNKNHLRDFVDYDEYNRYMLSWIKNQTKYRIKDDQVEKNLSGFAPPVVLLPNMYDLETDVKIIAEVDEYYINYKSSASQWKSGYRNRCSIDKVSISDDETCKFDCVIKFFKQNCSCNRYSNAIYMKVDTPDRVCRDEFYLLSETKMQYSAPSKLTNKTLSSQICYPSSIDLYESCMNLCTKGCEVWTYDASIILTTMPSFIRTVGDKYETNIIIDYPMATDIQIVVETNSQSWEAFIGNVGGLLGIWTGASIVSLIQCFYLCFCTNNEGYWLTMSEKQLNKINCAKSASVIANHSKNEQVVGVKIQMPAL